MPSMWLRDAVASTPKYNNAQNMAPAILAFTGIVSACAVMIVALRVYVRRCMLHSLGADDFVMVAAIIAIICNYACFIGESQWGLGRHITAIAPENMVHLFKWQFFQAWLVLVASTLVKISICLLLLRLVNRRRYRYGLWALLIFIVVYNAICIGTIIFACIPVAASWDPTLRATARCFPSDTYRDLGILNSAVSMTTDVMLMVIPLPVIMNLQISRQARYALCGIMSLGLIAVIAGAVKTHSQLTVLKDVDRYYKDSFFVWADIESCFGAITASLPALRPLFTACSGKLRSTYNASSASRRQRTAPSSPASNTTTFEEQKHDHSPSMSVDEMYESPTSTPSKGAGASSYMNGLRKWTCNESPIQMEAYDVEKQSGIVRTKEIVTTHELVEQQSISTFPIEEPALRHQPSVFSSRGWPVKGTRSSRDMVDLVQGAGKWQPLKTPVDGLYAESSSQTELVDGS